MIKVILLVWVVLASIVVILWGLWEMVKRAVKRLFKDKPPKQSRPEDDPSAGSGSDDDNSWRNGHHFDMH